MYSKDNYIVYGTTGVCKIIDIIKRKVGNSIEKEYYKLTPVYDKDLIIYAPIENNSVSIRKIMTIDEVKELIKAMSDQDTIWIEDFNIRKETYNNILKSGDKRELVKLIKTLFLYQEHQKENGKKLYVGDEKIMKEAKKLLHEELALVLNINVEEVLPFILGELEPERKVEF